MSIIKKTNDLIYFLNENNNKSKKDIKRALFFIFRQLLYSIMNGYSFKIIGFGEFFLKKRNEKEVHHPITKKKVNVPVRHVIRCKFSQSLYIKTKT